MCVRVCVCKREKNDIPASISSFISLVEPRVKSGFNVKTSYKCLSSTTPVWEFMPAFSVKTTISPAFFIWNIFCVILLP